MGKARSFIKEQCVCAEEEFELIKKKKEKTDNCFLPAKKTVNVEVLLNHV